MENSEGLRKEEIPKLAILSNILSSVLILWGSEVRFVSAITSGLPVTQLLASFRFTNT